MSRNQKAPLLAFVLVAIVCALVLADTVRGEASERPSRSLTPAEVGSADPRALELEPTPDPIAPAAGSTEGPATTYSPEPRAAGAPDRLDEWPTDRPGAASPLVVGRSADFPSPATSDDAVARRRAGEDERSYEDELWPQSAVPGVERPIVAFTIFVPTQDDRTEEPTEQPSVEPTPESESESDGAGAEPPSEPDGPEDRAPDDQSPPGDGPGEPHPSDLGATP